MRRSDVPTPALLLDIDILDRNIAVMRESAASLGVKLRPHAKAHKCVEIAQRIMAAGAIGISCATIGEAEAMALGGIGGILITAPLTSTDALERLRRLLLRGADIAATADHPRSVAQLAAVADTAGKVMGDKKLQSEGKMDKAKGSAHNIAGDVKDAVRKAGE